jgi:predicted naringenin-chalcone synthase
MKTSHPALILALSTAVPEHLLTQEAFVKSASRYLACSDAQRTLLKRIAEGTQIAKRHTVVADFLDEDFQGGLFGADPSQGSASTKMRNEIFKKEAPLLAEKACLAALEEWGGDNADITHVISISCTGLMAPGLELVLMERLGLSPEVERLGITFMGCFGAFKGLAIAKALALENPKHRILVVCTELCSLHFQAEADKEIMVANSLFADGSAAVIVGSHPTENEKPLFEIHQQKSITIPDTLDHMTWDLGETGFRMRLSATIPANIEKQILSFIHKVIAPHASFADCSWAMHPGGKGILEGIERGCQLQREDLAASWKVLNEYGNMSSPTFLFVLKELLNAPPLKKWVVGMGFGPGLSMEGVLLKHVAK